MLRLAALLATALLVVVVALLFSRPPMSPPAEEVELPSRAPTPSATVTPSATPSPSASVAPLPTVAPGSLRLTTTPLRDPADDWAFIVQRGFGPPDTIDITDTILAVRLRDGRAQVVVSMRAGSRTGGAASLSRVLDEQFAPDGRQLVLSVAEPAASGGERATLVLVELATGAVRKLTSDSRYDDFSPRWSPDGRRIAFLRNEAGVGDAGLWTIDVSGRDLQQVLAPPLRPNNSLLYGWTGGAPEGRILYPDFAVRRIR